MSYPSIFMGSLFYVGQPKRLNINLTERTRNMRLSKRQLRKLVTLYEEVHGKTLSFEQAQDVGLAIMRLVLVKEIHKSQLTIKEINDNGNERKTY